MKSQRNISILVTKRPRSSGKRCIVQVIGFGFSIEKRPRAPRKSAVAYSAHEALPPSSGVSFLNGRRSLFTAHCCCNLKGRLGRQQSHQDDVRQVRHGHAKGAVTCRGGSYKGARSDVPGELSAPSFLRAKSDLLCSRIAVDMVVREDGD